MCENTTHQDKLNTLNNLKTLTPEEECEKQNLSRIVSRDFSKDVPHILPYMIVRRGGITYCPNMYVLYNGHK